MTQKTHDTPLIKQIDISRFRGVAKRVVLDLTDARDRPQSLLLHGDNGSGKSTFVDALEFALQGRIAQHRGKEKVAEFARSLASTELPTVKVAFQDGTSVARGFVREHEKLRVVLEGTVHGFQTPLVLRRADILRFWDTPAERRQLVFIDYGRPQKSSEELPQARVQRLEMARIRVKEERRQAVRQLEGKLDLHPGTIPPAPEEFEKFVNFHIYKRRRRGQTRQATRVPTAVHNKVNAAREKSKELRSLEKQLREAKLDAENLHGRQTPSFDLVAAYDEAAEELTKVFRTITGNSSIERLSLSHGDVSRVSLGVEAHMSNGRTADPATVLSEANRDLVALLVFLSIARAYAKRGQARVIILDDVFQSVDASIRVAVMDYILKRFAGWQLIITVHDRLWREQVRQLFQQNGHPVLEREIVRWSFEDGPVVRASRRDIDAPLRESLERADPAGIAAAARLLLEEICDTLSWTLPISIKRRRGDRYTLGELWPGVYKELKRTNVQETAHEIERYVPLRNLVGAHYNEWAKSTSLEETTRFGQAVLALRQQAFCDACERWVEQLRSGVPEWRCRCGASAIQRV